MRRLFLVALALAVGVGCVPKGRHDEALAENAALTAKVGGLEGEVEGLNARVAALDAEIAELRGQLEEAQARLEETQRKLSTKVAEAGALQADIEEMQRALRELEERRAQTEATLQSFRDLVSKFQAMIDAGTLRVRVIDGRMVVELATDILFAPGAADLSAEGKKTLAEVAAVLASIAGRDFQVAGHTDNDPIATSRFPSNWDLGAARAITVTRLLVSSGLPADRVSAASYADTVPVAANDTPEGKTQNRRIEIVVVPDLSLMPGYEELQRLSGGK